METTLHYRFLKPGEEGALHTLLVSVFHEFVAPDFLPQGIQEFLSYISTETLLARLEHESFVLVAATNQALVGMIEMRHYSHVSLLFVDRHYQGRGIARCLLHRAIALCRDQLPDLAQITVNATPYALPVYKRLGFTQREPEQVQQGVRFIPMVLALAQDGPAAGRR
jgi:GNAT superfamily N-acetyltransferase